jgi:Flp pilus assembly protein TadB
LDEFTKAWAAFIDHVGRAVERAQGLPADQLLWVAGLAFSALALVLVAWIWTFNKLRKARTDLAAAEARSAEVQAKYDAEVRWRLASTRVKTTETDSTASTPAASSIEAIAPERESKASRAGQRAANTLRLVSPLMTFLALLGWGAFVYAAKTSMTVDHQLREELAQLKARQEQLVTERDQAQAQVAVAQQELTALQRRLQERPIAGPVPTPVGSDKPAQAPARAKRQGR